MVINALAIPVNTLSAAILRRFITTTSTYLGLKDQHRPIYAGGSEFVDLPRFRHSLSDGARRTAT